MNEDSRRDLLARQHRALYGNESPAFFPSGTFEDGSRSNSQAGGTPSSAGVRGPSPRGVDHFGLAPGQHPDGMAQAPSGLQSPSRAASTSSPSSGVNPVFGSEGPVTSNSSPRADSPSSRQAPSKAAGPIGSGVGPIGSRPAQQTSAAPVNSALSKRSTTPLPSPLGYGFTPSEAALPPGTERSTSVSNPSGPASGSDPNAAGLGWGNGSGVWGSKNGLGVQASVWG